MTKLQQYHKVLYQLLIIIQSLGQVKMRFTSQLSNGISRALQKLLKYFNGTDISTFSFLSLSGVFPVTLILDLGDLEFTI